MANRPLAIRVQKRRDVLIISGVGRSARGTKFTMEVRKINVAGMDKGARSKAIESAVLQILSGAPASS